jgi:RimJ/RimL family protein N-acetyltransferase
MFALLSDPKIYRYEGQPPASLEWLRERFQRLESRRSPDGREQWLNWVIRLPSGEPAGYVQATVHEDGRAAIAFVLGSKYWDRGLGRAAVTSMLAELRERHSVREATAVLKRVNARSRLLLERLGFASAPQEMRARLGVAEDEELMHRIY